MARARNIKPAFFLNTDLAENSPLGRIAFIGMWTIADYKGCLEYNPKKIKAQLLPYDDCDMESLAINLDKSGFISFYSVQGKRYIKILNFEKHQNPHKNEKESGSEIPDITEKDNEIIDLSEFRKNHEQDGTTRADSLIPLTDSLNIDSLIPESSFPITESNSKPLSDKSDDFLKFYASYPKKVGKEAAIKAWKKHNPPIDEVLKTLQWQKESQQWKKNKGQFVPNPATYINEGRWHDEPPADEDFSDFYGSQEKDITSEVQYA